MGLKYPRPVIVLVGGATGLRQYHIARLHHLFHKVLAPLAEAIGAAVIDGGTNCGIMRMMGIARQANKGTFPLVGVSPVGVSTLPNQPPAASDAAPLDPNHTHFLLIPGSQWGDDSPWIAQTATTLAAEMPSVTVLVNGGEVTWQDAAESVKARRTLVAIAKSGRCADVLASALQEEASEERAHPIVASGLLKAVGIDESEDLKIFLEALLGKE
jgi:hypothetical protein